MFQLQSVSEKMHFHAETWQDYISNVFDLSGIKGPLTLGLSALTMRWGGAFQHQLVFWIATVWLFDYVSGTVLALKERRWTATESTAGLLRVLLWGMLLIVAHGVSEMLKGDWIHTTIVYSILITETISFLEKIEALYPKSRISRIIRAALKFLNRRFAVIADQLDQVAEAEPKTNRRKRDNSPKNP